MIARDLREWISQLEKDGDLIRIKEELKLEPDIGALGKATCDIQGPAILAENIEGYETPVAMGLHAAFRRCGMAMGLPKDASFRDIKNKWRTTFDKYPMKSKIVSTGPCKENILLGDHVTLFQFRLPRINLNDASFYFTKTMCVTKDPDSDWVNMGMYRAMILDRNRTGIVMQHFQQGAAHYFRSRKLGKPLEMAIVYGAAPHLPLVSGAPIPWHWNEFDFAGALRGEPEELVMCETINVPVPATAELVLEGELREPAIFEGPFGEFAGSYSTAYMTPTFHIKAITYRNNPIMDHLYIGRGRTETDYMTDLPTISSIEQEIIPRHPEVTEIAFLTPKWLNCVVQGKWTHRSQPLKVMAAIWGARSLINPKMVTLVDEDIDPWNADEVMWAIGARVQADSDIYTVPGSYASLDPSQSLDGLSCMFGINATKSILPKPRHNLVEYVTPRKETAMWKDRITKWMQGGGI
ncbi:UbiD family decarboxylase [Chloroflexota bacterium]